MPTLCSEHTLTRAGWQCTSCNRFLCPDCAILRPIRGASDAVTCAHCANLAKVLVVRKHIAPYWKAFPTFLRAMFSTVGVIQLFAVALALTAANLLPGGAGRGISTFIFVSYYFHVIRRCAQGLEHLPEPDDFTGLDNYWVMTRFSFATALIWAPAAFYVFRNATAWDVVSDPIHTAMAGFDIYAALMIAGGLLYYPAAIIAAAIAESILAMLNPLITIRMILRIPGQYFATVAVWLFLAGLDYFLTIVFAVFEKIIYVPILTQLVWQFMRLPIPLLGAFIMGRMIFQNAEDFGIVKSELLYEPEWPGAKPRGTPRPVRNRIK